MSGSAVRAPPVHTLSQIVLVLASTVDRAGAAAAGAQRSVNPYDQAKISHRLSASGWAGSCGCLSWLVVSTVGKGGPGGWLKSWELRTVRGNLINH